jgi:hypothetical protein
MPVVHRSGGRKNVYPGVPMRSDSRADKPSRDHLCFAHWLLFARVTWGELATLEDGGQPSMQPRLDALEKARLCPRCRAREDARGDAAASPSARARVMSAQTRLGDLPPTHARPGRGGGRVIFGLLALSCAVAVAVVLVMLGSAPGVNAPQTRTTVDARPDLRGNLRTDIRARKNRDVYVDELRKGECIARPIPEGDISTVKVGPCSQPHREEVYSVFNLAPGHYAGQKMVDQRGDAGCRRRFAGYIGIDYASSNLDYFAVTPYFSELSEGREVECIVVDTEPHTRTLEGARR